VYSIFKKYENNFSDLCQYFDKSIYFSPVKNKYLTLKYFYMVNKSDIVDLPLLYQ